MAQTQQERRQAAQPPDAESAAQAAGLGADSQDGAAQTSQSAQAENAQAENTQTQAAERADAQSGAAQDGAAGAEETPDGAAGAEEAQGQDPLGQNPQAAEAQPDMESEPEKAGSRASKAGETASLKTKVEQLEKKLAESKDTLLRTAAEYENFRKRSAREHDAAFDNGVSFSVTALLPVLDTLELAANAETADEGYKKGVLMTLEQCHTAFDKMGVKEIEAMGKPFDPELHAAVMQQPATQEMPSGTVTQVMQKGYLLHDKVVRHAMVAVAE